MRLKAFASDSDPRTKRTSYAIYSGSASPEGSVVGNPGDVYLRTSDGNGSVWTKQSGSSNSGWVNVSSTSSNLLADGSAPSPALAFVSDNDTGLFRKGTNNLGIAAGGVEVANIDSNGILNLLTTSAVAFEITRSASSATGIKLTNTAGAMYVGLNGAADIEFRQTNNAGTLYGSISSAGLWTLGASGGSQGHLVNGRMAVGGAASTDTCLIVRQGSVGTTSGYGVFAGPVWTSSQSTEGVGIGVSNRGNATFNAARATAILIGTESYTAGAAVTRVMGLRVLDQTQGSTGNASICDNSTFTGNWFINQAGTNPSRLNGSLRVGTASIRSASFEQASILQIVQAANVGSSHSALTLHSFNSETDTTAKNSGLLILVDRSTSVDRTDTNYLTGQEQFIRFYPSAGTTYTNNSGNGVSHFFLSGPQNNGAGSLAISQFYGIRFNSNTVNSGTRKTAISFGSWSGATNNAFIADNSTYTGNWFINSTSTNPNRFGGAVYIGGTAGAGNEIVRIARPSTITNAIGYGIFSDPSWTSSQSTEGFAIVAQNRGDATFNAARATALYVPINNYTAGAAVARVMGLQVLDQTQGSTGNASICDNSTFTGNWFINSTSTNSSRLSGRIGVGQNPLADRILFVGSASTTLLTGTTQRIIEVGGANFNSNATSSCASFASNCSALPTTPSMTHFSHIQASVTGTVTRERAFGISAKATGAGSVTNFAGISDNVTFTGDWFINSTSTNPSLISGALTVGSDTSVHQVNGGVRHTVRSISSATTLDTTTTDFFVLASSSSGAFTITLPTATAGRKLVIKDSGGAAQTNNITISPASGTIDGASSFVLNYDYQSIDIVSDGTNWFVV